MSLPAQAGGRYTGPVEAVAPVDATNTQQLPPPDDSIPVTPIPHDPGFEKPQNPDGSEIGPLYVSPEGERWIDEHVWTPGYTIDWKNRVVIDPDTGDVIESVPTSVPRMI